MINLRKPNKSKASAKKSSKFRRQALLQLKDHPVFLPAVTFVVLCILALGAYLLIKRSDPPTFQPLGSYVVIISHDHKKQTIPSKIQTVGSLLSKLHLNLKEGDVVEPSRTTL
ncbi:MAG: hypothetical protein ACREGF_03285, partial [Candidatus Saccharimonadales bacterium]